MTNAEIVRRFENEFKNEGNLGVVDELMASDFVHHLPFPGLPPGREGMKQVGHVVFGAVRDIVATVDFAFSDGDLAASRLSNRGVRKSDDQPISWTEHDLYRLEGGKIKEFWGMALGLDLG